MVRNRSQTDHSASEAVTPSNDMRITMGSQVGTRVIREDVINALREMNTYIDVTVEDLEIISKLLHAFV